MAAVGGESGSPAEVQKEANLAMIELSNMIAVPMSLLAVVRLNVPAAIWQSGTNSPLSAAEILPLLRPPPPPSADPAGLQRLLRLLASHGVFAEQLSPSGVRRFSLTPVGQTLVPAASSDGGGGGDGDGPSYAAYVLQHHQEALVRAWPLLHEAVLDPEGPEPFKRANGGTPAYAYYGGDGEANQLMQRAMWGISKPFMDALLDSHAAIFAGVGTLVDVGGSSGDCLRAIMQCVPTVRLGVNFDLPDVVAKAPDLAGVKHVGGDMFKSIPAGDAIFMKWILMTWTDEECMLILKNCYNALPESGKVIACEPVLPEETDSSHRTRALLENDIFVMTIYRVQGRGRTEEEFRRLGLSVGFSTFRAIYFDLFYTVLEFQK